MSSRHRAAASASIAWVSTQLGCAALIDYPDDPELIATGPWRCLEDPVSPIQPTASTAHVTLPICDALLGCSLPPSGLTGRLCARLDPNCANPLPTTVTYDSGVFDFNVPTTGIGGGGVVGFDGFLAVSAPTALCTDRDTFGDAAGALCALAPQCDTQAPDQRCDLPIYLPTLQFFNPPIAVDQVLPTLTMTSLAASTSIAQAGGTLYDPSSTGSLLVTIVDCDGTHAAGISLELEGSQNGMSQILYVDNGIVNPSVRATDATGFVVVLGVPTGFVTAVATDAEGTRIGSVSAFVAASTNTFTHLIPTP